MVKDNRPSRSLQTIKISALLMLPLLMSGCGDQLILERLGFTQSTAYDLLPDGRLKISVSIPKADPEATVRREVLTTVARTSKEGRILLSRKTNLILVSGQLRSALFGQTLAQKGLWSYIDTFQRDPSISPRVKIVVVNGEASKLLGRNFEQHPRTGQYIDRLLEKTYRGHTMPRATLYDFIRDYYDDGIDPIAPIVVSRNRNVELDGIALFDKDKFKMKIAPDQSLLFSMVRGSVSQGELSINLNNKRGTQSVMLDSIQTKRKLKVYRRDASSFEMELHLTIRTSIREYLGTLQLSEKNDRHKLETDVSEHISKQLDRMISSIQKHGVDSLGFGKVVRNSLSYNEWKALDWTAVYPQIKTKCLVDIKIKDHGKLK